MTKELSEAALEELLIKFWSIPEPPFSLYPTKIYLPISTRKFIRRLIGPLGAAQYRHLQRRGARPKGRFVA